MPTFMMIDKITIITAAVLIPMSAPLKMGQYGNWRKSTTWPRRTAGARNNRSSQVAADAGTQEAPGDSPTGVPQPGNEADAHKAEHADPGNREDRGEPLTLAERGAGVADQPPGEQAAEQPDGRAGIELADRDDLGHDIESQPGHGHGGPEQSQSPR